MIISPEHTVVIFNGHQVQGWSEDADAIGLPDIELASVRRGADGKMAAFSSGNKGGQVTLKLLPNSPSTRFFMQQVARILDGASVVWNGTVQNPQLGSGTRLLRGVMITGPGGLTQGMGDTANRNFVFEFERVIPDWDGADLAGGG